MRGGFIRLIGGMKVWRKVTKDRGEGVEFAVIEGNFNLKGVEII
jgi:hypothetical protein